MRNVLWTDTFEKYSDEGGGREEIIFLLFTQFLCFFLRQLPYHVIRILAQVGQRKNSLLSGKPGKITNFRENVCLYLHTQEHVFDER